MHSSLVKARYRTSLVSSLSEQSFSFLPMLFVFIIVLYSTAIYREFIVMGDLNKRNQGAVSI